MLHKISLDKIKLANAKDDIKKFLVEEVIEYFSFLKIKKVSVVFYKGYFSAIVKMDSDAHA